MKNHAQLIEELRKKVWVRENGSTSEIRRAWFNLITKIETAHKREVDEALPGSDFVKTGRTTSADSPGEI